MAGKARYSPIANHAFIADSNSTTLVSRHDSMDWCCVRRIDALDVAPPLTGWRLEEIAIDPFHHLMYAATTSLAYSLQDEWSQVNVQEDCMNTLHGAPAVHIPEPRQLPLSDEPGSVQNVSEFQRTPRYLGYRREPVVSGR
jgi:hypothetical protein